jgi:[ribosomal protein S5]-alanine N-acetyltransferase
MKKESLIVRYQKISDAKRLYEILKYPHFKYFNLRPKSLEDTITLLKKNTLKKKNNLQHNFSIIIIGLMVGGMGLKVDQHRKHIAEIGYFIDRKYQGRGIATQALKYFIKNISQFNLKLKRLEIIVDINNKVSQKVAVKAGFIKEGLVRKKIERKGKYYDGYLYSKIL